MPVNLLVMCMLALSSANSLANLIASSTRFPELNEALAATSNEMGFQHYALTRHPRRQVVDDPALRLHNYPLEWEESYDRRSLGLCDPVHRACHRAATGFRWLNVGDYVPIGDRDEEMLEDARIHDMVDGYTVPANVPGEPSGSVTFVVRSGRPFPGAMLLYAQALGALAYQQARVIAGALMPQPAKPAVTDRQIEVAKWVGMDKSDWEIAQILDIAPCTVTKHVRDLCARLDASRRTSLALRVVAAGYLCFADFCSR